EGHAAGRRGTRHATEVAEAFPPVGAGHHRPAGAIPRLDEGLVRAAVAEAAHGRAVGRRDTGHTTEAAECETPVGAGHHRPAGAVPGLDQGPWVPAGAEADGRAVG